MLNLFVYAVEVYHIFILVIFYIFVKEDQNDQQIPGAWHVMVRYVMFPNVLFLNPFFNFTLLYFNI